METEFGSDDTIAAQPTDGSGRGVRPLLMGDAVAIGVLCLVVAAVYVRLPRHGDIWWMDASRHALNGTFVLDFLHAMPWRHPMEFATQYYRQWPALTIGFYPPLFSFVLAASYACFGISEAAALIVELGFLLLLGCGAWRLSRRWLAEGPSLAVAVLLIGAPEVLYWGQQIMLDVPAYALLIWAAEFHLRYVKDGSAATLYASALLAVLAIYTKYNAAFFVVVMALSLLQARGWRLALDRTVLRAAGLGALLLLPLVLVFYEFSALNLQQAASVPTAVAGRWSFAGLTWYARTLPSVISWPTLVLAAIYGCALPFVPRLRLPRNEAAFLIAWLAFGYVFYSMIAVKEPRHILFITFPLVLAAVLLIDRTLAGRSWRTAVPLALAAGVFAFSATTRPAPYVTGLREAADQVARLAPPETNVAFWGRLDGTFIYAMRAYSGRGDLGVVRLDKLLLGNVAVSLDWGFTQAALDPAQIVEALRRLHVQYVVAQTGYGDDIAVVGRLWAALRSDTFAEVGRVRMGSNYRFSNISDLVIYRAVAPVPRGRVAPAMEVKVIGRSL